MWQAPWAAVQAVGRAIAYDRRGFGHSQAQAEDYSGVADLMAVIAALAGDAPAILVGCSQGGRIAIEAALRHPAAIRGLVLIAPSGGGGTAEPAHPPAIASLLARQQAALAAGELEQVNAIKARLWLDGPLAPEGRVQGPVRQLFLAMNGLALRAPPVGANTDAGFGLERLGELRLPCLVMAGALDFPHIQDRCRRIAAAIPGASTGLLAGVAHLPSLERPAVVTPPLLAFLRRLSGCLSGRQASPG